MPAFVAAGAGVEVQKMELSVGHGFQDMGMSADKKIGFMNGDLFVGFRKIVAGITSDVGNKYFDAFAIEDEILRM